MKRAVIYCRVSSDDQSEKGYSLPSQNDACLVFAERAGFTQTFSLMEDHSGATPIAERPQGAVLMGMIKRREIDAVIVYQIDRLSRDIVNLLATVQIWLRTGIEIYSLDMGKIESELDIVLVIKGWQGSDERKKIRERTMRGKLAKAKAGKVVGTRPPYGYKLVRDVNGKVDRLEPVEERAQIVRLIYRWYVIGDESGKKLPANAIARRLSEMGVPTPGETNKGYATKRKRETGQWPLLAVLTILSSEVYAGKWHFGVRIGQTGTQHPRDEWITVNVPVIIEHDLWELAQAQRERNLALSKRNSRHDYLLSGYIKCACGLGMSGNMICDHRYYSCSWRKNHHNKLEKRACKARSIRADALELDVWESIEGIFSDTNRLERLLRIAQQEEISAFDPKQDEYQTIQAMIADTENEALEIGQALRRASGIVEKSLEKNMVEVNKRYDALCQRRDILLDELSAARLTDGAINDALQFAEDMKAGIQNADYETKRYILDFLQVKVIIENGHFYVNCLVGSWDGEIRKLPRVGISYDLTLPVK